MYEYIYGKVQSLGRNYKLTISNYRKCYYFSALDSSTLKGVSSNEVEAMEFRGSGICCFFRRYRIDLKGGDNDDDNDDDEPLITGVEFGHDDTWGCLAFSCVETTVRSSKTRENGGRSWVIIIINNIIIISISIITS